jgi:16S rRNA (guanine(966)-N(2))-methyltransferase RsmD
MIITGGEARGRRIASPEGLAVRPTASKIRQAFFNILGAQIHDARFLDVFAGSGLMGFEALSRGAAHLVSIEENRKMVRAIETTLQMLGFEATVLSGDFRAHIPKLGEDAFDIIFADPPYKTPFAGTLLRLIDRHPVLKPGGMLIIEHTLGYKFPQDIERLKFSNTRNYGQTGLSFFERV